MTPFTPVRDIISKRLNMQKLLPILTLLLPVAAPTPAANISQATAKRSTNCGGSKGLTPLRALSMNEACANQIAIFDTWSATGTHRPILPRIGISGQAPTAKQGQPSPPICVRSGDHVSARMFTISWTLPDLRSRPLSVASP